MRLIPSYPQYKKSGAEWLGDVPTHWQVRRLKADVANVVEQTSARGNGELYIALEHVESWTGQIHIAGHDMHFDSKVKRFQAGDVLFGKLRPYLAKVAQPLHSGICVGEFLVLRPRNGDLLATYLELFLRSKQVIDVINASTFGAKMPRADWTFIGNLAQPLPSPSEQAAIVRYLDHVDRRIRRYIGAEQRLIGLLEEQRRAVIHRAVTRGLDPNVRLKSSGIKWLGDVPAHWEVRQLGRIGRFSKGSGGTKADEVEDGVPCIRYGDLYTWHQFFITKTKSYVTEEISATYTPTRYGDVLFAGSGETIDEIGKSAVNLMSISACCGGDVILFRPSLEIDPAFLGYATDCPQAVYQKACMGRGITVMHIYSNDLKYLTIALPSLPEQAAIVEYLDKKISAIATTINRARREIELLREYRTRLIADVVTGKVDVREAAASLLDEADKEEREVTT